MNQPHKAGDTKATSPAAAFRVPKVWIAAGGGGLIVVIALVAWLSRGPGGPIAVEGAWATFAEEPDEGPPESAAVVEQEGGGEKAAAVEPLLARRLESLPQLVTAQRAVLASRDLARATRGPAAPAPGEKAAAKPSPTAPPPTAKLTGGAHNWEIHFPKGNTLETYARQLDFFGIELGVLMPDNKVIYASGLAKRPQLRTGAADAENRYYLLWRRGDLPQADHDLFAQASVDTKGKLILRFLPVEIEGMLEMLEKGHAADKIERIEKTAFGIRSKAGGYEFYVMEQTYLEPAGARP